MIYNSTITTRPVYIEDRCLFNIGSLFLFYLLINDMFVPNVTISYYYPRADNYVPSIFRIITFINYYHINWELVVIKFDTSKRIAT